MNLQKSQVISWGTVADSTFTNRFENNELFFFIDELCLLLREEQYFKPSGSLQSFMTFWMKSDKWYFFYCF